jgi:hypothetical protein
VKIVEALLRKNTNGQIYLMSISATLQIGYGYVLVVIITMMTPIKARTENKFDCLFVYGIFLDEYSRRHYGMVNPRYDTVSDYATYGGSIVTAYKQEDAGLALTGLTVDVPKSNWGRLDALEGGYDRVTVKTNTGKQVFMYVGKE